MADSQSDSNVFSVRIVSIDYYMAPPIPDLDICYSSFQGGKVNEVPVIRVYGSTPAGQKTCLHIHRALPYFYSQYEDLMLQPRQEGDACTHCFSLAIEKALKLKGRAGSKRQHVHNCSLVRAKKFYGYHSLEELFAKIYLYYPHDVSRAANLLLGGAVLDKSLQPHESHIPFLLQFLVDFNLYGMGHLHVSSLKFRHPIPNVFSGSKTNYNEQHAQGTDTSTCTASGFKIQVVTRGFGSPVWISSTIPDGWMWQPSSQPDASSDPNFHLFKRQSTCELEGDITVDEILNQQFKMYSSLSQTRSDVKMVRSRIPIWEEEHQRTGIYEAVIPPDPGKPLPHDVLSVLSHGLGFENKLRGLCSEAEIEYCDTPSTRSSVGEGNVDEVGVTHPKSDYGETSKRVESDTETGSQGLPFGGDDRNTCGEGRDVCLKQLSVDEMRTSDTTGTANQEVAEKEALGLLRWLVSSQAADDINSDDELVRETILSPLLPATTIGKVLEKANMDYESESQQECRDILDSIEDSINFEVLNEKAIDDNYSCQTSSEKTIPQVDGSSDDLSPFNNAGESSKAEMKSKSLSQDQVRKETDAGFTGKHEKNKPLWGSLPFSSVKKVNDDLHYVNINMTGRCGSQTIEGTSTYCQAEDEADKGLDVPMSNLDRSVCDSKEASALVGCSVRELMRRKRSYRVEPPESETRSVKKNPLEDKHKEDLYISKFNLDFPTNNERLHRGDPTDANCMSTFPMESEILITDDYVCQSGVKSRMCMHSIPEMSSKNLEGKKAETRTTVVQSENCVGGLYGTYTCLSGVGSSTSSTFNTVSNPPEHICMTFHKKPPKVDLANEILEDPSFARAKDHTSHGDNDNYERISGHGTVGDRLLPFFAGDGQEEREFQKSCRNTDFEHCQQTVMGIPTHYQNDGSYLYLLTPVFSPPSAQNVSRWLLHDDRGILGDKVIAAMAEPSSPEVSGGMGFGSQGSLSDACEKPSQESGFKYPAKQNVDQLNEQSHSNYNAQISLCNEVTTLIQDRGKLEEVKDCSGHSQDLSQISGPDRKSKPTPLSQIGFRDPANVGGGQQLTLFSIEVQAESRADLRPDPRFDAVNVIVLAIQEDKDGLFDVYVILRSETESIKRYIDGISSCKVLVTHEEKHLFNQFIDIIGSFDPDILMGWDIQGGSLGYLVERASHLGINLLNIISRTPSEMKVASRDPDVVDIGRSDIVLPEPLIADYVQREDSIIEDEWGRTHASGVHVGGRVVLNIWRLMRNEVKLNMYTVESVSEAVLRQKVPSIPFKILAKWFSSGPGRARHRCLEYIVKRAKLNLEIMNQLDMINRTSELARIFGIDFFSVLSRGSQYRVESMFLRLAHTQNYLAISPGNQQVASQPAMECIPLVMEPESGFYADPVVVLDFQSLYPSMIIAYNLCFCTCLGNVTPSKANTLGVSFFSPDAHVFRDLKDEILLTPNGVMYVSSKVREGILPRLLEEILSTRIMVKQAMKKLAPSQQVLHRIFNAWQLALKLIANVTYGYTAAGFSGRMPCAELADSIVQCGRRTLENAISFVNSHDKWQAKVIYGDTDSMFVLLKGRTKREAFQIGKEIASAITAMNPNPVTLKMEKVYSPCFLLTKKRYVGYSYESPDQIKPMFDAKGIETVRRDTCGAVAKTMEQSLRPFFDHQDVGKVKEYLQRQWTRILSGRVSLQDFVFAKEVRLGTYSTRPSSLPPAAIVASKAMRADPRAEPRYGERIPYVVVHGEPGSRLVDMVVDPLELLAINSPFRLNGLYYISKQIIPTLQRVFGLVGADLRHWFSEMPRPGREAVSKSHAYASHSHRTRFDYYYLSKHCIMCGELVQSSAHVCSKCTKNEASVATAVIGRTSKLERDIQHLVAVCRHCGGGDWLMESGVKCTSLACSVFYERRKVQKEVQSLSAIAMEAGLYPSCMVEWF